MVELATRPATFGEVFDLDALAALLSLDVANEDPFGNLIRCEDIAGVLVSHTCMRSSSFCLISEDAASRTLHDTVKMTSRRVRRRIFRIST